MEMSLGATCAVIAGLAMVPILWFVIWFTYSENKPSPRPNLYVYVAVLAMFPGFFTLLGGILSLIEPGGGNPMNLLLITWGSILVGSAAKFFNKSECFDFVQLADASWQI